MNANHTHKLFFGKYAYRVTIRCPHISGIRYPDSEHIANLFKVESYKEYVQSMKYRPSAIVADIENRKMRRTWESRFLIYKVLTYKEKIANSGVKFTMRLESDTCGFYFNNEEVFNDMCRVFKDSLYDISWPKDSIHLNYLLSNPTNEIVNNYPHNKYQYRINLRNVIVPKAMREGFKDWVENYSDLKISETAIKSIESGGFNLNGKFLYSTNKEMMLLLQMYLGDAIKSITEFKLEKEI